MYLEAVDLNCDMGEGYGHWTYGDAPDAALMDLISSANVAAGFHAGDPNVMNEMARLAAEKGVGLGAHPGYHDLQGFGRRVIGAPPEELVNDVIYQVGALREFGRRHGIPLQHVKPHGALYMTAAKDETLSRMLVEALMASAPEAPLYCMDVSITDRVAREMGHPTIREFFADRDYDLSGQIVFVRQQRPLDPQEVAERTVRACVEGKVKTVEGEDISIQFESICFHSDTPGSLAIGTAVRDGLLKAGIAIRGPGELLAAA
ncbi:MAG: 5-oxoprolinase subunit PxpA [Pseudomonadota bacterium]